MTTRRLWAVLVLVMAGAGLLAAGACSPSGPGGKEWQPPKPVKIEGGDKWGNLFPSYITWEASAAEGKPAGMLVRDGDVLVPLKGVPFIYKASDGAALKLTVDESRTVLAGRVVALSMKDPAADDWVEKATPEDLAALRMIMVPDASIDRCLPAVKKIAAANPGVGLQLDSGITQVLPLLKPRVLILGGDVVWGAEQQKALAAQTQIETLLIFGKTKGSLDVLPKLTALRRLAINSWDVEQAGPLPQGCQGLRSLMVIDSAMKDLSPLANAPAGLEELSLLVMEPLADLGGLAKMPALKTVILNGSKGISDVTALTGLKELRWLGLPPAITQAQLAAQVKAHPDLKVLELVGCEGVTDLAVLKDLKGLEAVVLVGPYPTLDALTQMKSLRFVGIFDKTFTESPDQVAAIQKALPDALVVPAAPMCLGSGWLLMLVPAVALVWLLRKMPWRRLLARGALNA